MATKSTDQKECEEKKEEGLELKYTLSGVTLNLNKVASCPLRMPPVLPRGFTENGDDPVVFMHLLPSDKGEKKTLCQKKDLLALGDELEQLSSIAKELTIAADVQKNGPQFDTYQIDDLIKNLKQVTEANLDQIYPEIKGHAFFWVREHRKKFFVYDVAVAMKEENKFRSLIEGCKDLCSTSWDKDDYDGFLAKMNDYRTSINRKIYDGSSRIFSSGDAAGADHSPSGKIASWKKLPSPAEKNKNTGAVAADAPTKKKPITRQQGKVSVDEMVERVDAASIHPDGLACLVAPP
ncbi:putative serine/threonine protein kinase IRE [Panicum miliaceum]|uniref:Serine/threonine protein kinase IRE n=1 Tax=Panicum miliaceum TaxID=4540 RepID=A0A3L6SYQ5_PANMI|nr:putative serine/threonine protein kinase IRE [Panicum miliaceum]